MKHYIRILILLLNISVSGLTQAHDENLATIHIRHSGGGYWQFELMTPLHTLDQSMRAYRLQNQSTKSPPLAGSTAYKEAVVAYVKSKFEVYASGRDSDDQLVSSAPLALGQGRLRLDNHVSTLLFEIKNMPSTVEQLEFNFPYMEQNPTQNNVLKLIDGDRSKRYILNFQNHFSGIDHKFFSDKNN